MRADNNSSGKVGPEYIKTIGDKTDALDKKVCKVGRSSVQSMGREEGGGMERLISLSLSLTLYCLMHNVMTSGIRFISVARWTSQISSGETEEQGGRR